jgi:hypothetical protein
MSGQGKPVVFLAWLSSNDVSVSLHGEKRCRKIRFHHINFSKIHAPKNPIKAHIILGFR